MLHEPKNFDCRSASQVLALRLRDWMWLTAVAVAMVIPLLALVNGSEAYRIGSFTFYLNTYGPLTMLAASFIAGLRWCWLGHLRPSDARRCAICGNPLAGPGDSQLDARCSGCGADATTQRTPTPRSWIRESFHGVRIARLAIDLPGMLLLLYPLFVLVMVILMLFGVVDD